MALWLEPAGTFEASYRALQMAHALGVDAVCFDAVPTERWHRFVEASRLALPALDLAVVSRGAA